MTAYHDLVIRTYSNGFHSALAAGYSETTAKEVLHNRPKWLTVEPVLSMFSSRESYVEFVSDYEEMRNMLAEMKYQLADR